MSTRIPVILDTDIGTDIDDTWALVMLLNSPELDVRLIVSATGDTTARAQIIAKLLEIGGRADIPIGIGPRSADIPIYQHEWAADYDLSRYPGPVHSDGVEAIVQTIMDAPQPVTLIAIGPLPNVSAALEREPRIAERARFVGMHGSVRRGYGGKTQIDAEYNVRLDPQACRRVFSAPWSVTITPVDTCGVVQLRGPKYAAVRECSTPLARALMENYRLWAQRAEWHKFDPDRESSTLFDTVAVYLAFAEEWLTIEELGLRVTDDGYTLIDETARKIRCATEWKDLEAFEDLVVRRITAGENNG